MNDCVIYKLINLCMYYTYKNRLHVINLCMYYTYKNRLHVINLCMYYTYKNRLHVYVYNFLINFFRW